MKRATTFCMNFWSQLCIGPVEPTSVLQQSKQANESEELEFKNRLVAIF